MVELESFDIKRFIGKYSIGRDSNPLNFKDSLHFLRIKIPGGVLTSDQFRGIADLAKRYGRGRGEITDRQDIQLHWIEADDALQVFSEMEGMGFTTDMCGQGFSGPRYGDVRNIVCCPVSGIDKYELLDVHPLMNKLGDFFIGNSDFQDMPRKFKFAMTGCGADCVRAGINDLAFTAVEQNGEVGFTFLVGGSIGASLPGPKLAQPTSLFIRPDEVVDVARATTEIHRDEGNRESKAMARFKWLINRWGVERFREVLEEKIGRTLDEYKGSSFQIVSDHHGIQPQSQRGYYYVTIPLIGGGLSDFEMLTLANYADEYGSGELRITPQQNIILFNVKEKDKLVKELERSRFRLNGSNLRWNSIGCASDFCGKTEELHAKEVVNDIITYLEKQFDSTFLDEANFQIHASGCPNNCCATLISGIGLEGRLLKEDGKMVQYYRFLVGGAADSETHFAQVVEEKVMAEKLKYKIKNLITYYRREKGTSERLGEFCRRIPIEKLRSNLKVEEG